jgi:hypothetical protein
MISWRSFAGLLRLGGLSRSEPGGGAADEAATPGAGHRDGGAGGVGSRYPFYT